MGILEYVIGLRRKPKNNTVIFLGLDNSGKTTLLRYLAGEARAISAVPTQGFLLKLIKVSGVTLQVLDVGGHPEVRPYWRQYYSEAAGIVFVLDSTHRERLPEAYEELEFILEEEKLQRLPLLLLANKQDHMDAVTPEEIKESLQCNAALQQRRWKVQCCSALTGEGVLEGMSWLLTQMTE